MYFREKDIKAKYVKNNALPTIISNKTEKIETSSHF